MPANYLYNPSAYGRIPQVPPTTTQTQTATRTPQFPQYPGLAQQASGIAGKEMAGMLDPSVWANIGRAGAERGIATGSPLSPNADASYLAAIGKTTQDLEQQGFQNYLNLLQASPSTTNETQTQSNALLQALYAAAPDPYAAAMADFEAQQSGIGAGLGSVGTPRAPTLPEQKQSAPAGYPMDWAGTGAGMGGTVAPGSLSEYGQNWWQPASGGDLYGDMGTVAGGLSPEDEYMMSLMTGGFDPATGAPLSMVNYY